MATLLLFGAISEIAGSKREEIEASTLGELLESVNARFGERFGRALEHCAIAIDGKTVDSVDPATPIEPGSEIAVLPPVSGGAEPEPAPRPIRMADVSEKPISRREATAGCRIVASQAALDMLESGNLPKGDAIAAARIAAVYGAKLTPQLVPLCHPVRIDSVDIDVVREAPDALRLVVSVRGDDRTGFEMEALAGAAAAALTIYDMTKSIEPGMKIEELKLLSKSGGKSGHWVSDD